MSQKAIKTKRSNSARLMGMIENKLKIPGGATTKLDRSNSVGNHREFVEDCSEDCDTPDILPILRRTTLSSSGVTKDPRLVSTEGLMKYEEMLKTLKCGHCAQTTCPPLLQCRKGHLYCRSCKVDNKIIQCNTCKQTFVDAPNLALDNLVRLIAVPCKFGGRGCPAFVSWTHGCSTRPSASSGRSTASMRSTAAQQSLRSRTCVGTTRCARSPTTPTPTFSPVCPPGRRESRPQTFQVIHKEVPLPHNNKGVPLPPRPLFSMETWPPLLVEM